MVRIETKICIKCGIEKPLNEFYFRKDTQCYRNECKSCMLAKQKEIRIEKNKFRKVKKENKPIPTSKVCSKCHIEKPINQFRKNSKGYIFTVCKQCEYKLNMERYYKRKMQDEHYKAVHEAKLEQDKLFKEHKKKCLVCFQVKDLSEFYYRNDINEYRNWCKECEKKRTNTFYKENKQDILEEQHKYYKENREIMLQRKKIYADLHKEQLRDYHSKYMYSRRKNDDIFHFKSQIRHLINQSFRRQGKQKDGKIEEIVGCDFKTLYKYLLETYKKNYGVEWDGKEDVHIDHIIPLSTANSEEEIIKLCYYTNLQLLKAKDNLNKSNKLNWKLEVKK